VGGHLLSDYGGTIFGHISMAALAGLAGGIGLGLTVALRKDLPRAHRILGALLLVGAVAGSGALVAWLRGKGTDAYLETQGAAAAPGVPALDLPDPGLQGPFPVRTLIYGSGKDKRRPEFGPGVAFRTLEVDASPFLKEFKGFSAFVRKFYWGFGKDAFPRNGRVWYPEGPGPFPLVLCVHGNHRPQEFSDPGYGYLGEHLASRGFIFVSVDENFLNDGWEGGIGDENAVRGWMLLKHLEAWRGWSTQDGHPFQGKVDMDRISLVGHSRGGEAVTLAAAYNTLPRWPEDATQAFRFGFHIRSVVAIAPSDGQYETSGVPTPVRNVDYLVLQGSHDSDVGTFFGQRTFRRVAFTDGLPHFKASLYFHRANHGQFNTVWGARDMGTPMSCLLAQGALMPGEDQRRIARVAIGAFLEATLKERRGYAAFFRDPRGGAAWLPRALTLNQFEDQTFRPLATFDEDLDPCTTTAPGGRIEASGLTLWKEGNVKGRGDWSFRHQGVWLGWEGNGDRKATATYAITLPPAFDPKARLARSACLVLTLADTDEPGTTPLRQDARNKAKEPVDFTVELADRDGRTACLPLSALRPLQPVLKVQHSKWGAMEDAVFHSSWEPVFQTFELPLAAFEKAAPDFKAGALRTLRLRFDRSARGVVILDQVGFRFQD
jgi:dienelactone hydrolase